ncbi:MAG: Dihydropteroate synthase [Glaciecola sp. HTCC2999]|jgi:dihydropteroate synthase|nr:MAG: Dihydropteroate synthase [Glaciecola sp. HTCC2999]
MQFGNKHIYFDTPKVMGVLNVTPDSFSDGGQYISIDAALNQAEQMVRSGATFIDIGGESTRPGADAVDEQTELERVVPVIEKIAANLDCVISVDTSKAKVMRAAVEAGARLINDVCALQQNNALETAASLQVPISLMHMQGEPRSMQIAPDYESVVGEVYEFLELRINACLSAGINQEQIIVDPGFGFGKTLEHNYQLLKHFDKFQYLNVPTLAGMSRKSMVGNLLNRHVDERLAGSLACALLACTKGASILRVHDVQETADTIKVFNKMNSVL